MLEVILTAFIAGLFASIGFLVGGWLFVNLGLVVTGLNQTKMLSKSNSSKK